jgi:hypothetical protein
MFEGEYLDVVLAVIEPLWTDTDRFKQRAAAELIGGVMRGEVLMHRSGRDAQREQALSTGQLSLHSGFGIGWRQDFPKSILKSSPTASTTGRQCLVFVNSVAAGWLNLNKHSRVNSPIAILVETRSSCSGFYLYP